MLWEIEMSLSSPETEQVPEKVTIIIPLGIRGFEEEGRGENRLIQQTCDILSGAGR